MGRPAYALDFLQVHSYPDVRYPHRNETVFGRTAARGHLSPAYSLEDYLTLAREGGYLGAWPWSFKGVEAFGAPDLRAIVGR